MKKFELHLVVREEESFNLLSANTVVADDLVHLLAQFLIVVIQVQKELNKPKANDDDIPF